MLRFSYDVFINTALTNIIAEHLNMKKIVPFILLAFFSLRLFASVGPHLQQLEHDSFTILRSVLIVGAFCFAISLIIKRFKKPSKTNLNSKEE